MIDPTSSYSIQPEGSKKKKAPMIIVVIIFLSSVAFQTLSSVAVLYLALFSSGLILFLSELTHIIFGWGSGILVGPGSNLLGNWYDFGIFFGLMTLLALILIEFGQRLSFFRRLSFILIILSLLALVFVNFSLKILLFV